MRDRHAAIVAEDFDRAAIDQDLESELAGFSSQRRRLVAARERLLGAS